MMMISVVVDVVSEGGSRRSEGRSQDGEQIPTGEVTSSSVDKDGIRFTNRDR